MDAYDFCYSWRWTQPTYNVLPDDVMAQIKPVDRAPALPGGWTGEPQQFPHQHFELIATTSADLSTEAGTDWLRSLPVSLTDQIVVCWGHESVAVETTWEIFTRYWDDFCYPSDDVQVFPLRNEWLLLYHDTEVFEWGRASA